MKNNHIKHPLGKLLPSQHCAECEEILLVIEHNPEAAQEWYESGYHVCDSKFLEGRTSMSGKPNPEGIKSTVAQLNRIEKLTRDVEDLEQRVNSDTRRLGILKESLSGAWGEYKKLMDEMDLTMEGNTGFEKRAAWFFVEMKKQLTEQIKNGDTQ